MSLSQESVLSFLLERGGQVRNWDLVEHFRSLLSGGGPEEQRRSRELFKRLVNSVAVVRHSDGVKFVVVRKRYQDFVKDEKLGFSSPNKTPRSAAASHGTVHAEEEQRSRAREESVQRNSSTMLKVLSISGEQSCRSGAVFAVIAVKSPDSAAHPLKPPPMPANSFSPCTLKSWGTKQTEGIHPPGSPLLRPQSKSTKHAGDATETVPLEPLAHQWLVKCAAGLWGSVYALLLRDTRLVHRKDFMSGFTALHWAAKDGNVDAIHKLLEISSRKGTGVHVNCKSHGGYTPLHIAAIHGHAEVLAVLVQRYGASVNERDNDGKKALHYLEKGASAEVRGLLGGLLQDREKTEDDEDKEQHKGFNTISKLFHPHSGRRHKTNRFAQEW